MKKNLVKNMLVAVATITLMSAYAAAVSASGKGWVNTNGTWYYLKEDGVKTTGWLQDTDNNGTI